MPRPYLEAPDERPATLRDRDGVWRQSGRLLDDPLEQLPPDDITDTD